MDVSKLSIKQSVVTDVDYTTAASVSLLVSAAAWSKLESNIKDYNSESEFEGIVCTLNNLIFL